jgi:hypothetical protein
MRPARWAGLFSGPAPLITLVSQEHRHTRPTCSEALHILARRAADTDPWSWLLRESRLTSRGEASRSEQVQDTVSKISEALCSNGYKPILRIEDVEVRG